MKRSSPPWPVLIEWLAQACLKAAKDHGVTHGGIRVYETEERGETIYVIAVRVPASETVPSRSMPPPKTK